tara:strand:- start:290 stop:718 length:429 start_codon:yes stop_codon:yes gene_type:complete
MVQKSLVNEIYKKNLFLSKGCKENVELCFKKACSLIKKKTKQNPILQIKQGINIIKPYCETKSIKMKNNVTRIPVEITKKRQQLLATSFFLKAIKEKNKSFLHNKLSNEILNILTLSSTSLRICENFQKNVEINKIFIQYRF